MNAADLHKSKTELAKMVLAIESEALIEKIMTLIRSEEDAFYEILSDEQKADIELGISQADMGQMISLDDVIKKVS